MMKKHFFSSALSCAVLVPALAHLGCTGDLAIADGEGDDGGAARDAGTSVSSMNGPDSSGGPVGVGTHHGMPTPAATSPSPHDDAGPQPDATTVVTDAGPAPYGDSGVVGDAWVQPDTCPVSVLQPLTTVADTASIVEGQWVVCDGLQNIIMPSWAPSDTVGIEFTTATENGGSCNESIGQCLGGLVYFLVQGATGLERGPTNDYQKYYSIYQESDTWVQFDFNEFPNNGGEGSTISYSPSPVEFNLDDFGYQGGVRMVRP
jgi:hypothetical protein